MLPGPLRVATYLDPVFYAVDAFWYAAVGVSDAPPYPALIALVVFAALAFLSTVELIRRGYKLRYCSPGGRRAGITPQRSVPLARNSPRIIRCPW
jgi:hypothetical protein